MIHLRRVVCILKGQQELPLDDKGLSKVEFRNLQLVGAAVAHAAKEFLNPKGTLHPRDRARIVVIIPSGKPVESAAWTERQLPYIRQTFLKAASPLAEEILYRAERPRSTTEQTELDLGLRKRKRRIPKPDETFQMRDDDREARRWRARLVLDAALDTSRVEVRVTPESRAVRIEISLRERA